MPRMAELVKIPAEWEGNVRISDALRGESVWWSSLAPGGAPALIEAQCDYLLEFERSGTAL